MRAHRSKLLSTTVIQMCFGAGLAAGSALVMANAAAAAGTTTGLANPDAVAKPTAGLTWLAACNPCAAKACNPCAAKACNPCAAKACNPCAAKACNPCAAKACNPCNPCRAAAACNPCNPCNPCAGGAASFSAKCQVPRLVTAALCNPCAAKACNPCAAKACNPCAAKACNPCAAKACNPCAAKACNPCRVARACNPCAAKACNPCAAKACNPCAAKACNPCAAKACNPCAAKGCNPCAAAACNPCAAAACNPCNPCGPCGAAEAPELTTAEVRAAYDCLRGEMVAGYARSGMQTASFYKDWAIYNSQPYVSDTHGGRFVNNYANVVGSQKYGKYEDAGRMPVGAMMAKDSFVVRPDGKMASGPLFLMEKMPAGFSKESGNWRYTMIMADGAVFGTTNGQGSNNVRFCIECHAAVAEDQDSVFFLPEEYRN